MREPARKVSIKQPKSADNVDIREDPFRRDAYVISLHLDAIPSYVWHTLFQIELVSSLDFWDRKVLIVGDELKLVTTRDNLQGKLDWLEKIVAATNKRVDEHAKTVKIAEESKKLDVMRTRKELYRWFVRRSTRSD
jgi:hypothetical protein